MSNETTSINEQLAAAIAARKDSLKALRGRIAAILEDVPIGVTLSATDSDVKVKIVRICTGASQWANREWEATIKGKGAIVDGKLLCEIELDDHYWDGNNMHRRKGEPTCLYNGADDYEHEAISYLSGAETRKVATMLPAAIEKYMAKCEEERAANDATLA
jgi:hypothetical protein